MIIIHAMNNYHKRAVEDRLLEHLRIMPVVVLLGARQTGKSTLVQNLGNQHRRYETLDDFDTMDTLSRNPDSLLRVDQDLTLDEVQRLPNVLLEIKRAIDQQRQPGRYLLTGSANLLLMQQVADSLAGRASYLTLWPMTRREQLKLGTSDIWDTFMSNPPRNWSEFLAEQPDNAAFQTDWRNLVKRGGYPIPALELSTDDERLIWFNGYLQTYLERDVMQLANISSLIDFRRLTTLACQRIGQLVNQSEIGRTTGIPQPTVNRYLNLLETSYQLIRLPAYSRSKTKRLSKSPKLYWNDTGVALNISGDEPGGAHLENLILNDLLVWRDAFANQCDIFHWRTAQGDEVDFVIAARSGLLPIEIKSTTQPRLRDTTNLRIFLDEYSDDARAGLLLHAGDETTWLTNDVLAVPWWQVI